MNNNDKFSYIIQAIKTKAVEILPKEAKVILYGSRARGDYNNDSDWDLHILIPGPEKLAFNTVRNISYPFEELGWEIGEEINTMVHSFVGWEKRKFLPIYQNIKKEGITL